MCGFVPVARISTFHNQRLHHFFHPHHLFCGDMNTSFDGKSQNGLEVLSKAIYRLVAKNVLYTHICRQRMSATKPILASAIESIIQSLFKYIILSQFSSLTVNMNAASNKAILKGNISRISISARNCIFRFKFLSFRRLELYGANLQLGYLPFFVLVLPFFLWRLRRYIQSTIITLLLLQITGCLDTNKFLKQIVSAKRRMYCCMGSPLPPCISYSLSIESSDISNSLLIRFWLRNVLQSLVQNSVVGAAAAFGDAAQQGMEAERRRMQKGTPLLPAARAAVSSSLSSQDQKQQQGLTSALLSATSFKLKKAGFMDGRVVFDANAVLPKDENGVTNSLQFCIRAKLAPTAILETVGGRQKQQDTKEIFNALGFLNPECRLATGPLYAPIGGKPLLRNLVPNLIPEYLWLPFGMGVAVLVGKNCEIYRANVVPAKEGHGYICKIDGSVNTVKCSSKY